MNPIEPFNVRVWKVVPLFSKAPFFLIEYCFCNMFRNIGQNLCKTLFFSAKTWFLSRKLQLYWWQRSNNNNECFQTIYFWLILAYLNYFIFKICLGAIGFFCSRHVIFDIMFLAHKFYFNTWLQKSDRERAYTVHTTNPISI